MSIKSFVSSIAALFVGISALSAQTPEEIVKEMTTRLARCESEGFSMDFSIGLPIVGTFVSHNMVRGEKLRSEMEKEGKKSISWTDATTKWSYDVNAGEITISTKDSSTSSDTSDMEAFEGIVDGYDLVLQKETVDTWYILCKKSRKNKDKNDPKRMELAVAKTTYLPVYLRARQSLFSFSIENITPGVSEESVTFDPAGFPGVKIIDNR